MKQTRILLVDDHNLVRSGIRALLEKTAEVEIVAEACDGLKALEMVREARPEVVLMDIVMPGLNGIEATGRITREFPEVQVIILSMHANEHYLRRAMAAGAVGYLMKTASIDELHLAIKAVASGKTYYSLTVSKDKIVDHVIGKEIENASYQRLTPREREVLQLLAEGRSAKMIAEILKISVKTVDTHRAKLMNRLNLHDVAGLVRYALRIGLITIDDEN